MLEAGDGGELEGACRHSQSSGPTEGDGEETHNNGKCKDRAAEHSGRVEGCREAGGEKTPQGGKNVSLGLKGVKKG